MAKQQKRKVYFYETYLVSEKDGLEQRAPVEFWQNFKTELKSLDKDHRRVVIDGTGYAGVHRQSVSPARTLVYLGRLRSPDEWPDTFDVQTGDFAELQVAGGASSLAERSYLLDYGRSNVAVMGASFGAPRVSSVEGWLTQVSGVIANGFQISLRPIVNPNFRRDLNAALGARSVVFKVDRGTAVPKAGGGDLGAAARAARSVSGEIAITIRLSAETAKAADATTSALAEGVKWLVDTDVVSRGEVSLVLPDGDDGRRVEHYDFFKSRMTETAVIRTGPDGTRASEDTIVGAIADAIAKLRRRQG